MQPSSSSGLNCRVEVLELDPGILGREAPVDATTGSVACRLPGHDLPLQRQPIGHPPIQALLRQHAQPDLGHVQPAAMLGRVVQLEPVGQPLGLSRLERLVQRRRGVGVEVVLHQHDLLGIGVVDVDQVLDAMRPVDAGAPRADRHVAPAAQRLAHQEQVAHAAALVLVILPGRLPWRDGQGRGDLCEELAAGLVQAHLGPLGVVGLGVDRQHILHAPDELGVVLWGDAPALGQPRLEAVYLKAWRTVSYEIASTTSKATRRSPSSRNVHRLRPSGGALHASATRRASCSPSSLRRYWRSGALRDTAASSPPVAYSWRTRATVVWWTSSAAATARSVQPGPASPWLALSRIRAWVRARAGATPCPIRVWSRARSGSDRTTTCCLRMLGFPSGGILDRKEHGPNPRITQITADELLDTFLVCDQTYADHDQAADVVGVLQRLAARIFGHRPGHPPCPRADRPGPHELGMRLGLPPEAVREGAVGKGPKPRAPRRRPTSRHAPLYVR